MTEQQKTTMDKIRHSKLQMSEKMTLMSYINLLANKAEEMPPQDLRFSREYAGLSITQAAKLLNITWEKLNNIESGTIIATPSELARMNEIYGLGVDDD